MAMKGYCLKGGVCDLSLHLGEYGSLALVEAALH